MNRSGPLAVSLLLNVALAAVCIFLYLNSSRKSPVVPVQAGRTETNAPGAPPVAPVSWEMVESPVYAKYLANLRAVGCPEDSIKQIVISDVDKFFASVKPLSRPSQNFEYWKVNSGLYEEDDERMRQQKLVAKEKRALIKHLLGVELDESSLPSDSADQTMEMLGFLPKEKQHAVSEIEASYASRTVRKFGGRISFSQWPEFRQLLDKKYEELEKILTPEELEEYDYRFSRVAQDIRNTLGEFKPTEKEFRAIVKIRKAYEDEFGPYLYSIPGEDASARNKREAALVAMNRRLKEALGESRYADYEHEREYRTSSLRILAAQYNIPKETIFQAFDVRQYAQEAALRIRSDPALSEGQKRESLRRLREESEKSFSNLLGKEAFEAYMRQSGRWLQNIFPR